MMKEKKTISGDDGDDNDVDDDTLTANLAFINNNNTLYKSELWGHIISQLCEYTLHVWMDRSP